MTGTQHKHSTTLRATVLEDGSIRVHGSLSPGDREQLELTHFDTGSRIGKWSIWWPKVSDVDADHAT